MIALSEVTITGSLIGPYVVALDPEGRADAAAKHPGVPVFDAAEIAELAAHEGNGDALRLIALTKKILGDAVVVEVRKQPLEEAA